MVEVKRKKGETFESMFRRFTRHIVKSGKLLEAKSKRFFTKKITDNASRVNKLVRLEMTKKYEYLKKIGRIEETDTKKKKW